MKKKIIYSLFSLFVCAGAHAQDTTNYLMSYFKDATHSVYFAISRDGKKYGWGNNRAIVMMKSRDLINWSSSIFRLDTAFKETEEVGVYTKHHIFNVKYIAN